MYYSVCRDALQLQPICGGDISFLRKNVQTETHTATTVFSSNSKEICEFLQFVESNILGYTVAVGKLWFCNVCRALFFCSFVVVVAVAIVVNAVIQTPAIISRTSASLVLVADAVIIMAVCDGYTNHNNADNDGDEYSNGGDNVRRSSTLACTLWVPHCAVICLSYTRNATQHNRTCVRR